MFWRKYELVAYAGRKNTLSECHINTRRISRQRITYKEEELSEDQESGGRILQQAGCLTLEVKEKMKKNTTKEKEEEVRVVFL